MSTQRTALVTGGNRGIGLAICKDLAERGLHVVLGSRDEANGEAAARPIRAQGGTVRVEQIDVAEPGSITNCYERLAADDVAVDVLVNNAGIYPENDALDATIDQLDRAWTVNTRGPWLLVKAFVPDMIERGYGRVVNMSSGSGSFGEGLDPEHAAYAASKSALNVLTMTLDDALPDESDVKVNSMCPGWVHTRMGGEAAPRTPEEGADTALWLATLPSDGPSGGFFRDRERIPW
ncbi:SDR family NAD(P)-dependent oxidoreductase [Salinibacter sp. 10B]|uniref:SDR family NAD(P)-dependent oxidoreductase n=1 Tax=Salinibacter sp. 10B TaxID=1923971 RepID=UPI000CF4003C|nr:SDR family NAD(P)-dependent oxidoreductase [Salinibacter sp. 10B]